MAVSRRMLAIIQKIEAADAEHFARLRKSAKQEKQATKALAKPRAAARSAEARMVAKKRKAPEPGTQKKGKATRAVP